MLVNSTQLGGGSVEGRIKFAVEVARAVSARIGAKKTGIRISPGNPYNGILEEGFEATYEALIKALAELDLAYLHFMENPMQTGLLAKARTWWKNTLIVNTFGGEKAKGKADLEYSESGKADLVSLGQLFVANPDLVARLKNDGPFNTADASTFYGGDEKGYTDYPTLS